jgi:hypothetical protein
MLTLSWGYIELFLFILDSVRSMLDLFWPHEVHVVHVGTQLNLILVCSLIFHVFDAFCTLQAKTFFFCIFLRFFSLLLMWGKGFKPNRPKTNFKLIWAQHETPRGPMQAKDRHHPSKIAHTLQNKPQKYQKINPKSVQSGNSRNAVHPNCRINTEHRFDLGLALAWTWQTHTHTFSFVFFPVFLFVLFFPSNSLKYSHNIWPYWHWKQQERIWSLCSHDVMPFGPTLSYFGGMLLGTWPILGCMVHPVSLLGLFWTHVGAL